MPDRVVLVHFGAHKTGTTFLQSVFQKNAEALTDRHIRYDCILNVASVHRAFVAARHALRKGAIAEFERRFTEVEEYYTEFRHKFPDDHLLISYEGILGSMSVGKSRGLYPAHEIFLHKFMRIFEGERVHGAFVIREYGAFVESSYKQLVHMGYYPHFQSYGSGINLEELSWLPAVGSLKNLFGAELSLATYEDFANSQLNYLNWLFERAFGFDAEFLAITQERVNPSPSKAALNAMIVANRLLRFSHPTRKWVNKRLRSALPASKFGHPRLLDDDSKRNLKQRYADDLKTMRSETRDLYAPLATVN